MQSCSSSPLNVILHDVPPVAGVGVQVGRETGVQLVLTAARAGCAAALLHTARPALLLARLDLLHRSAAPGRSLPFTIRGVKQNNRQHTRIISQIFTFDDSLSGDLNFFESSNCFKKIRTSSSTSRCWSENEIKYFSTISICVRTVSS